MQEANRFFESGQCPSEFWFLEFKTDKALDFYCPVPSTHEERLANTPSFNIQTLDPLIEEVVKAQGYNVDIVIILMLVNWDIRHISIKAFRLRMSLDGKPNLKAYDKQGNLKYQIFWSHKPEYTITWKEHQFWTKAKCGDDSAVLFWLEHFMPQRFGIKDAYQHILKPQEERGDMPVLPSSLVESQRPRRKMARDRTERTRLAGKFTGAEMHLI